MVVAGPGVACPKSWRSGCEPAALESESFPGLPSRALFPGFRGLAGVGLQAGVDSVADPLFRGPQCIFMSSSFGYLLVVIGTAGAVLVAELGDRGHVDRVVDPPVAAQRQAVDFPVA
jgi:hypothetical protein